MATLQFGKTALVKAGWEAYFKGDLKGALAAFKAKESEAASANNPVALDGMGWTQLAMGEPKAAAASFAAALKIDANYYSSQSGVIAAKRADLVIYNTAWAKLEAGQFDEAKAKFEQARGEMPADIKWLIEDGLAWMAFYKKDYAGAQKAFAAVVAANPKAFLSHKGLGYAQTELKQYEAASKSLVTAYNLAPYQGVAAFTAPTVKMIDAGAFVDAREVLKLGELIYPFSADIQFSLARAYNGLNNQADAHNDVTVLFADLVGFTTLSNGISAEKLVSMLNDIMSAFDLIANQEGVEKIKTIGDCYMLASGIPLARPDHAQAVVRTALAMLAALESFNQQQGAQLQIRVGIHSGPVVAGVIGVHKYTYDLWGGTVNIASRMESTGLPGHIHVSTATAQLIRDDYTLESRGPVSIKGIGEVETFLIV